MIPKSGLGMLSDLETTKHKQKKKAEMKIIPAAKELNAYSELFVNTVIQNITIVKIENR